MATKKAPAASKTANLEPKIARRAISTTTSIPDAAEVVETSDPTRISLDAEHKARLAADAPEATEDEQVTVIVPKGYKLVVSLDLTKDYEAGTQEMPRSHAEHWWSRAQGVKIYTK